MGNRAVDGLLQGALALVLLLACSDKKDAANAAHPALSAARSAAPPATAVPEPTEQAPGRCKASGDGPTEIGKILADAYGFAGDATRLFYSSWDIYGGRGDLGAIRKDGQGTTTMVSLDLEPRGLAVDATQVFFTSGIRLMTIPAAGGLMKTLALQFSAQAIALHAGDVYGVPADYGPYDRVAKIPKTGGETKELASGKRGAGAPPSGYSAIAVDDSGIYVTDSGTNRVLRFPLEGGKPKILATGQQKAYALALTGSSVYFTLAKKGDLMVVPKAGGAPRKVASGLAPQTRLAADDAAAYTTLAGKTDQDPQTIAKIAADGSATKPLATVPASDTVQAIALDGDCVYWVDRKAASSTIVYAHAR
jgi:hypothetical protein